VRSHERAAIAVAVPFATLLSALALAAAQWPRYWIWIAPEQTPLAFVEALLLFAAALLSGLLALLAVLEERAVRERRAWTLASVGFSFLGADERFALHERLRDNVLADFGVGLPWGGPGDYLLLLYLGAGLALLPALLELLRSDRLAVASFALGVGLAAAAVLADSVDVRTMGPRTERLAQTTEEVVETLAASLFGVALFLYLAQRLAWLVTKAAIGTVDAASRRMGDRCPDTQ
jgi:hypothetical protein